MNCAPEDINFSNGFFALAVSAALMPLAIYAHETGHAIAFKTLFNNTKPKIILSDYGFTGLCSPGILMNDLRLSRLGQLIGHSKSMAITCAAGCIVEKCALVALRLLLPIFFYHDNISTVTDLYIVRYALSTFAKKAFSSGKAEDIANSDKGHDFIKFRMHAGLLPTYVLITALVGACTLSIFHATFQTGKDVFLYGQCLAQSNIVQDMFDPIVNQ